MKKMGESPVKCPDCGSGNWKRYYTNEQLEKMDDMVRYQLMKQAICNDCKYIWDLSTTDIVKHFMYLKNKRGKTDEEIEKEIKDEVENIIISKSTKDLIKEIKGEKK